jgi:hypothetical protein
MGCSESVWDAARREVVARDGGRWEAGATRAMMGMSSPGWSWFLFDLNQIQSSRTQLSSIRTSSKLRNREANA